MFSSKILVRLERTAAGDAIKTGIRGPRRTNRPTFSSSPSLFLSLSSNLLLLAPRLFQHDS